MAQERDVQPPLPWAPRLSGMMDTSLRATEVTSSQGPLVTSLHFLSSRESKASVTLVVWEPQSHLLWTEGAA